MCYHSIARRTHVHHVGFNVLYVLISRIQTDIVDVVTSKCNDRDLNVLHPHCTYKHVRFGVLYIISLTNPKPLTMAHMCYRSIARRTHVQHAGSDVLYVLISRIETDIVDVFSCKCNELNLNVLNVSTYKHVRSGVLYIISLTNSKLLTIAHVLPLHCTPHARTSCRV